MPQGLIACCPIEDVHAPTVGLASMVSTRANYARQSVSSDNCGSELAVRQPFLSFVGGNTATAARGG